MTYTGRRHARAFRAVSAWRLQGGLLVKRNIAAGGSGGLGGVVPHGADRAWPGGRRKKWAVLAFWVLVVVVLGGLAGKLSGAEKNDTSTWLPGNAEATQVVALQQRFHTADTAAAVIVYERASGITQADRAKATADTQALARVDGVTGQVTGPLASRDGQALQTVVQLATGTAGWTKLTARV